MKTRALSLAVIAAATLACPKQANATIALDFGLTGQRLQTGFNLVSGASSVASPFTVPSAALPDGETVTISSTSVLNFRDRGNIAGTNTGYDPYPHLFEDYLRAGNGMAFNATSNPYSTLTIDVGQLAPLTEYRVTIRIYDGAIALPGPYSFTITGPTDTNLLNNNHGITFHETGANSFSGLSIEEREGYTETFFSNASGNLQVTITQTAGGENTVPMNSFELVMIPEPGSAFLAAAAGLVLLSKRRRHC